MNVPMSPNQQFFYGLSKKDTMLLCSLLRRANKALPKKKLRANAPSLRKENYALTVLFGALR
jgi:hypothetical protein